MTRIGKLNFFDARYLTKERRLTLSLKMLLSLHSGSVLANHLHNAFFNSLLDMFTVLYSIY